MDLHPALNGFALIAARDREEDGLERIRNDILERIIDEMKMLKV